MWERSDVLVVFANSFRQADPFATDPPFGTQGGELGTLWWRYRKLRPEAQNAASKAASGAILAWILAFLAGGPFSGISGPQNNVAM